MSKPWRTRAWKEKRLEFLEGKTCDWCGSRENLAIHHSKHFKAIREYRRIARTHMIDYFSLGKNKKERQDLLKLAGAKNIRSRKFQILFFNRHRHRIDELYAMRKKKADEMYMSFKNVMVLCRRCHFAKEKGLVICEICKERYHKPKYGKCWECFRKSVGEHQS